jgi:DNA primase
MDEPTVRRAVAAAARASAAPGGRPAEAAPVGDRPAGDRSAAPGGGRDPVARLERQVLEVALQLPAEAAREHYDELPDDAFTLPAHRAVHDAIRAAGGTAAATGAGGGWAGAVREAAPAAVAGLVTELAVSPLPEDRASGLVAYAQGILAAFRELGLTRQIATERGRLERTDPGDPGYRSLFEGLVALEERRRALRERV